MNDDFQYEISIARRESEREINFIQSTSDQSRWTFRSLMWFSKAPSINISLFFDTISLSAVKFDSCCVMWQNILELILAPLAVMREPSTLVNQSIFPLLFFACVIVSLLTNVEWSFRCSLAISRKLTSFTPPPQYTHRSQNDERQKKQDFIL